MEAVSDRILPLAVKRCYRCERWKPGRLIGLIGVLLAPQSLLAGTVSIAGPNVSPIVGSKFTVNINIVGVSDLATYQFDIGFDPAVLTAISSTGGNLLE